MLVDIIKCMNSPQGIIASLIGLKRIYGVHCILTHSIHLLQLVLFMFRSAGRNGECRVGIGFVSSSQDKLPRQMIQSGP